MPDLGLSKAIGRAVRRASRGAKVVRPGEIAAREAETTAAMARTNLSAEAEVRVAAEAPPAVDQAAPAAPAISEAAPAGARPQDAPVAAAAEQPVPPPVVESAGNLPARIPASEPLPLPKQDLSLQLPGQTEADAARLSKASLGDYALGELEVPNFDRITTTDEIKAVLADTAKRNAPRISAARREVITNQQLTGLAGDLDVGEDVIRSVITRENGGVLNPETILAARQVLNSSADRLKNLADLVAAGKATDIEKVQFARQVQFHNEYQAQFMGARAEAGRALNAFNIPVGSSATQAARIGEIIASSGGDILELARVVKLAESTAQVTKVLKPGLFARGGTAANNLLNLTVVNGLLSSPVTQIRNTAGNALFMAMNIAETSVAGHVFRGVNALASAVRLGRFLEPAEHVQVGEAAATLTGTLAGVRDGLRLAARAFKTGQTLDNVLKYESGAGGRRTIDILPELDKPVIRHVLDAYEGIIGVPGRFLGAADEFFKTVAYRGDLERQAFLRGLEQAGSGPLQIENVVQSTREFLENTPEKSQKAAEDWARMVTLQSPLGPTGQDITRIVRRNPGLTVIAPFIKTPINIFKNAAYRSPVALLAPKFYADIKAGGRARDLALTRLAMGTATALVFAKLVSEDQVTGAGPQQPAAKMIWEASGKRPYSKKVTDSQGNVTWQSYASMEPMASIIGAVADTVEIAAYLDDDVETMTDEEQDANNAAAAIIVGVMNNTGNKTFMKGVADAVDLFSDATSNIRSYKNQLAVTLLPYSSALRFIRNTQDPYLREAFTVIDKLRDNTPGLSKDLPLRLDLFGEPRGKAGGSLLGVLSPFPDSPAKEDPVIDELAEVMQKTHKVPITMPSHEIAGMRLTAREYSEYVRIARATPIQGKTFKEAVADAMSQSVYQEATPAVRFEILKKVQNAYDSIAAGGSDRAGLFEEQDPEFAERITTWRLKKERLRFEE